MRELSLRLSFALLLCIVFAGIFAYIATGIQNETIHRFDHTIIDIVQGWETPALTPIMKAFTWIGSTTVVICLIVIGFALLFWVFRKHSQAYFFFFVLIGTGALNQILKFIFRRERPDFHRLVDISGYSFPSGHTMMAFSLYAISAFIAIRNLKSIVSKIVVSLLAIIMFASIAISRIYLGVHYPSDVVGGMAASAFWLIIATSVYSYYQKRKKQQLDRRFSRQ
ncbi:MULTISPECIES: phosphatase PAP2 family protein [Sporosarcina]|uniref:Phosphatase PAP2 family protein n=1 Tax=Sporosarcina contaminans TaxID=633403 RepID=A0ABW3TWB9_9BACL